MEETEVVGCRVDKDMSLKLKKKVSEGNFLNMSEYIRSVLRKETA